MDPSTTTAGKNRLLIIDSSVPTVNVWKRFISDLPVEVETITTLSEAMDRFSVSDWTRHAFDVVFLDLKLSDGTGLDLLPLISVANPKPRVAVIASDLDGTTAMHVAEHCSLVIPKPLDRKGLFRVLQLLQAPESYHDRVLRFAERHQLSERETQIVLGVVNGQNNDELAADLGCDRSTIGTYWSRIFKKTNMSCQRGVLALMIRSFSNDVQPTAR